MLISMIKAQVVSVEKSDEELVLACGQGDEEAWGALVARYQRLLYAIPRRALLQTLFGLRHSNSCNKTSTFNTDAKIVFFFLLRSLLLVTELARQPDLSQR